MRERENDDVKRVVDGLAAALYSADRGGVLVPISFMEIYSHPQSHSLAVCRLPSPSPSHFLPGRFSSMFLCQVLPFREA